MSYAVAILGGALVGYILGCTSCCFEGVKALVRRDRRVPTSQAQPPAAPATMQQLHASFALLTRRYLDAHTWRERTWATKGPRALTVSELAVWSAQEAAKEQRYGAR